MSAFILSLVVVFVAELGDKSQLMTLTFAGRYRVLPVLAGVAAGTALVHLTSVIVGAVLGAALPTGPISILAGVVFFGFAVWTLRGEDDESAEDGEGGDAREAEKVAAAARANRSIAVAIAAAFFLAELGDKTQIATITLAADNADKPGFTALVGVWAGATVGMVAADALAIVVGLMLGRRLPERVIRIGSSVAFAIFGVLLLAQGIRTVAG